MEEAMGSRQRICTLRCDMNFPLNIRRTKGVSSEIC